MYRKDPIDELSHETLEKIIVTVSRVTAQEVLQQLYLTPKFIKYSQAYRLYGRPSVERWIKHGLLSTHLHEAGKSRGKLSVSEMETLSNVDDIFSYEYSLKEKRRQNNKEEPNSNIFDQIDIDILWVRPPY